MHPDSWEPAPQDGSALGAKSRTRPSHSAGRAKASAQAAGRQQHAGLQAAGREVPVQQLLGDILQQTQAAFVLASSAAMMDDDSDDGGAAAGPSQSQRQGSSALHHLLARHGPAPSAAAAAAAAAAAPGDGAAAAQAQASLKKGQQGKRGAAALMYSSSTPMGKGSAGKAAPGPLGGRARQARFGIRGASSAAATPGSGGPGGIMRQLRPASAPPAAAAAAAAAEAAAARPGTQDDEEAAAATAQQLPDPSSYQTPAAAVKTISRAQGATTPAGALVLDDDGADDAAAAAAAAAAQQQQQQQHPASSSGLKGQLGALLPRPSSALELPARPASAAAPAAAAPPPAATPAALLKKPNLAAQLMYPSSATKALASAFKTPSGRAAAADGQSAPALLSASRSAQATFLAGLPAAQVQDVTYSAFHKGKSPANFNSLASRLSRQLQLHKLHAERLAAGAQPLDCIVAQVISTPQFEAHVTKCLCSCQKSPTGRVHLLVPTKATEGVGLHEGATVRIAPPWQQFELEGEAHPVVAAALLAA
jgi:hypothetical protein